MFFVFASKVLIYMVKKIIFIEISYSELILLNNKNYNIDIKNIRSQDKGGEIWVKILEI